MKTIKIKIVTAFMATIFICGCGILSKPTSKDVVKKTEDKTEEELTEGTVVVLESKMEKTEGHDFSDKKGIIISGKAKYIPAKINPVAFEDFGGEFQFILLDADGNKVRLLRSGWCSTKMGKYGEKSNVEPNEPFQFTVENLEISQEDWEIIDNHVFRRWY